MLSREIIKGENREKEEVMDVFGQALTASIPPLIRDCFGPMVEQLAWFVFLSQERLLSEEHKKE